MYRKNINKKGLTLVEILLYFFVVALVLASLLSFSVAMLGIKGKSENFYETQNTLRLVSEKIISTVRQADSINVENSIFGESLGALSVNTSGDSSVTFTISGGDIYMQMGNDQAKMISSGLVSCSKFEFERIIEPKVPDQIVMDIVCGNQQEIKFHTSITLRK